jgi:hypothetical protein
MATQPVNRHGRKPGRGLRPWLLIPKYLAAGTYFGGIVTVAALFFVAAFERGSYERLQMPVMAIAYWVILPGALLASAMGVALWLQHPKVFWRMRWFRLKLLLIFALLGPLEMLGYILVINSDTWPRRAKGIDMDRLVSAAGFGVVLVGLIIVAVVIITLGRLKPRLGQPIARSRSQVQKKDES